MLMALVCSCSVICCGDSVCVHLALPLTLLFKSTNSMRSSAGTSLDSVMRQSPSIPSSKMVALSTKCTLMGIAEGSVKATAMATSSMLVHLCLNIGKLRLFLCFFLSNFKLFQILKNQLKQFD